MTGPTKVSIPKRKRGQGTYSKISYPPAGSTNTAPADLHGLMQPLETDGYASLSSNQPLRPASNDVEAIYVSLKYLSSISCWSGLLSEEHQLEMSRSSVVVVC